MATLFDYLQWRGDLEFSQDGLNEVDSLIFSNLAYLRLDGIVSTEITDSPIPLAQIAEHFSKTDPTHPDSSNYYYPEKINKLLRETANTKRFKEVHLLAYMNRLDYKCSNQFSAVVFTLGNDHSYIAFRGTDNSIAGWKENFLMSFTEEVLAQKQAVSYVNHIANQLDGTFYLGGHSKGGNLAVYAGANVKPEVQDRILKIFSNDGPGFLASVVESEGYKKISHKVKSIIPKSSVVGMLLDTSKNFEVVDSTGHGIFQHDSFLWQVKGAQFIYEDELSKNSRNIDNTLRLWLDKLSLEQREQFFDALFEIIEETGAHTLDELSGEKLKVVNMMIKKYRSMDSETQSLLTKTIEILISTGQKVYMNSLGERIDSTFSKIIPKKPLALPKKQ
jgi:hypothetical protein